VECQKGGTAVPGNGRSSRHHAKSLIPKQMGIGFDSVNAVFDHVLHFLSGKQENLFLIYWILFHCRNGVKKLNRGIYEYILTNPTNGVL